jgi:hypothetical protein
MFALLHLRLDNHRWSAAHPSLPSAPCCLRSLQITSPLSRPSPVPPTHSPRPPVPFARTVSWSSGAALARCAWRAAAAAQPSATIAAAAQAAVAPSSMYSTLQHIKSSEALGLIAARHNTMALRRSSRQHSCCLFVCRLWMCPPPRLASTVTQSVTLWVLTSSPAGSMRT